MTTPEANAFRNILAARQSELDGGFRKREELAIDASPDDLDRIQQASDHDFVVSGLERNASQLREVRAALARLDAGTFGECLSCEEPINPKRLKAVPWAPLCIACQEAAESGAGMPFDLAA